MSFDNETEDLFDDGFEGSINEHKIFTEVFFGKDQIKTNKKCLVTGAISFASNKSKPRDMLPSLDNETSAISSQSNTSNINLSLNKHASSTRDDITGGKHMKLSTDEQSVFNSVTCRLVESIKQGIISSSYLLKGRVSMHSLPGFHENVDKVISTSKATLSIVSQESLHEIDEKELSARKAIPSPVSHESTHANDGEKYSAGEPIPSTVSQERSHENNEEVISVSKAIPSLVPQDESKTLSKAITSPVSQERFHESDEQMISASKAIPSLVCQEYFNESDENKKILSKASPLPVSQERFHEINEQIISAGKAIPPSASQESSHENCEKKTSASFKAIPALVSQESVHDNDEKRISTSTLITSSIYQESSATQSPTLITRGEKTMISKVDNLSKDKVLPYKDPRPLLRTYIQNLLTTSGWEITKRIRPGKVNGGYIYKSPQIKKLLREFTKVWDLLGQSLSIDRNLLVSEDGKQWSDMTSFWSDLSLTLTKFDEESSLAKRWCLLDPFVNLVLIEKKLGLLKAGKEVKAQSTLHGNEGAAIPSKSSNTTGIKSKRGYSNGVCKSSLTGESLLTNIEAMSSVSKDICGTSITADFERKSNETVNDQNSLCDEKCTYSQNSHGLKSNGLQLRNLDNNSVHSSSCLNEAPITSQNVRGLFSESVSPRKEGNPSSHVNSVCVSNYGVDPELVRGNINMSTPQAKSGNKRKRSKACEVEDDKLLLSPVVRNKKSRYSAKKSTRKTKPCRPKPMRKCNTKRGSCRLLRRSLSKGDKQEKKWYLSSPRTVLSWLINSRHVSLKEVIACQDSTDNTVVKEGLITKDGILCNCCDNVISVSEFKSHAGFGLHHPCLNLVMGSGKDYKFCELEAWADEYRTRKSATRPVEVEDLDQNDDSCGLCGNGGELICCENCPSTFHQKCLCEQEFPEGDWYCQYCSCGICGKLVNDKEDLMSNAAFKCSQCEHKYHEACMKEKVASQELASEAWLCGKNCQEVYLGLQSRLGLLNNLSDGLSWTLLRCTHEDQKVHFAQTFIDLKAERNLKLAVALTIMEECFQSMVDARTGIDMIPHVLYNLESEFARLNCHGFYTMVLEKDDVLISVASIRIHGVTVAEMPLIATCSKYRRQGMCRRLMDSIEEMLLSFKVEKLVITAIPDVVETWTVGFGFEPLEDHERKSLSHFNLMVFPGSVWLKKTLYSNQATDKQMTEMECCSGEVLTIARPRIVESGQREEDMREERNNHVQEDSGKILSEELALIDGKILPQMIGDGVSVDMNSEIELPKVSCGEKPTSKIGESQLETTLNVDSLAMDDARILSKTHYEKQPILDQGECGSRKF